MITYKGRCGIRIFTSSLPNVVLCEVTWVNNQIFHVHNNRWLRKLSLAESDSIYCWWVLNTNSTTVFPIPLYHGTVGTVHGSPLSHLRAPYPTVHPIPLYHGMGGTVLGSPLSLLKDPSYLSHVMFCSCPTQV